ncbi:hypothetical protein [Brevibacillus choshinensis]|uniref:DUF4321 domain-containing protein n=1 Tax=Brevibacillus choshinensis TaxID=54911 RepID=A0ABX7FVA3_BRECH|nr:hypothetical protein [Brevibacillus choshinensis]QRG70127.1 hypothetical protein JNE38_14010 [Brevibacillus choshinensis]
MGKTHVGLVIIAGAIFLVLLGVFLWKKGDQKVQFWEALLDVIGDIITFQLPIFFTFRAWAVFSWMIGIGILIIAIVALVTKYIS